MSGSRSVLFLNGPLRGEVREFDGWSYAIAIPDFDRDFSQIIYHVKRALLFGREFHFAAIGEPDDDDVLSLILTEAARAAMCAERVQ